LCGNAEERNKRSIEKGWETYPVLLLYKEKARTIKILTKIVARSFLLD